MFPRSQRLPSSDIKALLHHGKRIRGNGVDLVYTPTTGLSRWTVIVSAKIDKRATVRNRLKRAVREAIRMLSPTFKHALDGVIVVRKKLPDTEIEVETIIKDMMRSL